MVKIVHTSDLHLDATYAFLTGQKLSERREDFLNSLKTILDYSAEENADIILISGDFFDKVNPTNNSIYYALKTMKKFLKNNDCKIFIVSGNHDEPKTITSSRSPIKTLEILDGVKVATGKEEVIEYRHENYSEDIGIYLKGYDGLNPGKNPIKSLPRGSYDINIAVLHGSFKSASSLYSTYKDYSPFNQNDCLGKNFDYFALGHLHQKQKIIKNDSIFAYPGCPQRYSFKESDSKKGLFTIDLDGNIEEDDIRFVELPSRDLKVEKIELDKTMDDINEYVICQINDAEPEKLLNVKLEGKILFDAYKNIKISKIRKAITDNWFEIKIDKDFKVIDPHADYEFEDLKTIGPVKEFKKRMSEKIKVAKEENNEDLQQKYQWMYDEGLNILTELGEK